MAALPGGEPPTSSPRPLGAGHGRVCLACSGRWLRRAQGGKAGCHDRLAGRGFGRNDLGGTGGLQRVLVHLVRGPGDHRDVRGGRPNCTDGGFGGTRVVDIHDPPGGPAGSPTPPAPPVAQRLRGRPDRRRRGPRGPCPGSGQPRHRSTPSLARPDRRVDPSGHSRPR